MELKTQVHNIPPLYDEKSRVLILGSFPSVKSRGGGVFLRAPAEPLLADARRCSGRGNAEDGQREESDGPCAAASPCGTPSAHVRSWDRRMRASRTLCRTICPSFWMRRTFRPSSATAARPTPAIKKYCRAKLGREAVQLPSTSPANARWTKEKLIEAWGAALKPYLF